LGASSPFYKIKSIVKRTYSGLALAGSALSLPFKIDSNDAITNFDLVVTSSKPGEEKDTTVNV